MPFGTMRCGSADPFASGRAAALVPSRSSMTDGGEDSRRAAQFKRVFHTKIFHSDTKRSRPQ